MSKLNLKLFLAYGIVFNVITNLYQPFSAKFIQRIGGSDFHISLFNALPGLVMLLTILPGIILLRHLETKKATQIMMVATRLFLIGYVSVPFLPVALRPIAFVVLTALMAAPLGVYTSSIQSLTADIFIPNERANALGIKNKYSIVAVMLTTFITGQMLTLLPQNESQRLMMYQAFFAIAFLLSFLEYRFINGFEVVGEKHLKPEALATVVKKALKNQDYMIFVTCSLIFHFGWQMGWPLFSIYTIKVLGANEAWMSIVSIASMSMMFFWHSLWPKFINRYGNATVTAICTMGMVFAPIMYLVSKNIQTLVVMATISGIFTSGTITVLLSDALEVIPKKNRAIYMGLYMTGTNLTLTVAPLVGHYFLQSYSIQVALIITACFRLIGGMSFVIRNSFLKAV